MDGVPNAGDPEVGVGCANLGPEPESGFNGEPNGELSEGASLAFAGDVAGEPNEPEEETPKGEGWLEVPKDGTAEPPAAVPKRGGGEPPAATAKGDPADPEA